MKALAGLLPAKGLVPWFAVALVLLGCSTTKSVDWNTRVGSFTYDQAILELGPPDKQDKLSDGKTLAEWIVRGSAGAGLSLGTGFYGSNAGVGVSQSVGSGYSGRSLKLTFDTDGRLSNWSKHP